MATSLASKIAEFLIRLRDLLVGKDTTIQEKNAEIQRVTDENASLMAQLAESFAKDRQQEDAIVAAQLAADTAAADATATKEALAAEKANYEAEGSQVLSSIETFLSDVAPGEVIPPVPASLR